MKKTILLLSAMFISFSICTASAANVSEKETAVTDDCGNVTVEICLAGQCQSQISSNQSNRGLIPVYAENETTEVCETMQAPGVTFRRTQKMKCRNTGEEYHFFTNKTLSVYDSQGRNRYPGHNLTWDMSDGRIRIYRDGYELLIGTYQISNGELAWCKFYGDTFYPVR